MQWVEIKDTIPSNHQRTVALCILQPDGSVSIQSTDSRLERQLRAGIMNRASGAWTAVTPQEGHKFLQALPTVFNSDSRWATGIQQGEAPSIMNDGQEVPEAA